MGLRQIAMFSRAACLSLGATLLSATICWAQAPQGPDQPWKYLAALKPAERKATVEREAKREGALVLYGALGIDRATLYNKLKRYGIRR